MLPECFEMDYEKLFSVLRQLEPIDQMSIAFTLLENVRKLTGVSKEKLIEFYVETTKEEEE